MAIGTVPDHPYPPLTKNYHYEAELVAVLGKGGRNIPIATALEHVWATAWAWTRHAATCSAPWATRKSRGKSARASTARRPIGPIHKVAQTGHFTEGAIWLEVNGQTKQNANLNQMIWSSIPARRKTSGRWSRAT